MAELIKIYEDNPNPKAIREVVEVLKKGGLVIFPSDTVYGLGCDITNNKALEKVARIKGIKLEKANFSFICKDLSNLSDYVKQINTQTFKILKEPFLDLILLYCQGIIIYQKSLRRKKKWGLECQIITLFWQ